MIKNLISFVALFTTAISYAPSIANGQEIPVSEIRKLFTVKMAQAALDSCDVFEYKHNIIKQHRDNWTTAYIKKYYLPNHNVTVAVTQRFDWNRPTGARQFQPNTTHDQFWARSFQVMPDNTTNFESKDYALVQVMTAADRVELMQWCGFQGACECILAGASPTTTLARVANHQLSRFEPIVSKYIINILKDQFNDLADMQRAQIKTVLAQILKDDQDATNKIAEVFLSQLRAGSTEAVANEISRAILANPELINELRAVTQQKDQK